MTGDVVLNAQGLRRAYGDKVAVEDFTAEVLAGQTVVLVGPNGCGKTTSVEMCLGLRRADAGRSVIGGREVRRGANQLGSVVGAQLQGAALNAKVRVREHLQYFGALYDTRTEVFQIAEALQLTSCLGKLYGALSGGFQRRVLVAAALAGLPKLVMLDEPTSGVDVESRLELWAALRNIQSGLGTGILVTTHDLVEAEQNADWIVVMRSGRIVSSGRPVDLIGRSGLASVVTLRSHVEALEYARLPRTSGVLLQESSSEIRLGFHRREDSAPLWLWAETQGAGVSAVERMPTFEDAYLQSHEVVALRSGAHRGGRP